MEGVAAKRPGKAGASFVIAFLLASLPAFAQDNIRFASNDSDLTKGAPTQIPARVLRPRGDGPFPAVVLAHGCGGMYRADGRLTERDDEWARTFRDAGYVALQFDSFNPRGVKSVCRGEADIQGGRERARDAYGALLWLQAQNYVKPDRIALMGWSHGGITTIWTIRNQAMARPKSLPQGDFRAAVAFYPGCRALLELRGGWVTKIPVLFLLGDADDWTPAPPCKELVAKAKAAGQPVEMVAYPGAYHGFDSPSQRPTVLQGVGPNGSATIGTDPAGRADAFKRVPEFLKARLAD
jgi:dienelactone hydrolase